MNTEDNKPNPIGPLEHADAKLREDDEALEQVEEAIQEAQRKIDAMHKMEGLGE
jgi:hypothetical protein